ncbi:MAG: Fe-S-containing hydro-lyase [Clostridia bacterium]|nr:Fe-S-containing hydro-lyase [Clostridia bacterium]
MAHYDLHTSELEGMLTTLKAGDTVSLTGTIYTSRDAAHKKLFELLDAGKELPFELEGAAIYYAGPTPGHGGRPVGACGPTTSGRMDGFAPRLIQLGLTCMIGKGERDAGVVDAMKQFGAVYLCAVGGAGAIVAKAIKEAEVIAFDELGCESVKKMTVENFPATVAIDTFGNNLFETGRKEYRKN